MHDLSRLGTWADLPFFVQDLLLIEADLANETREVLPTSQDRFRALERTQPEATRVVILGQDPYPTPGHAHGLAFSVADGTPIPRSLKNIFRELEDDLGILPRSGELSAWADQGILLLNTSLSVPVGNAGGHAKLGWSRLTEQVLSRLSDTPRAFLLWGRPAQSFRKYVTGPGHLFIESPHPSPLSASKGFFGSRPFSRTNAWLSARGASPIQWA